MLNKLIVCTTLLALSSFLSAQPQDAASKKPRSVPATFGMVAYWGETPSTYSGQIPRDAYVVINPDSGALGLTAVQKKNYQAVIKNIRSQGGRVLAYIPTGYDQNTVDEQSRYAKIVQNVNAYMKDLRGVDGFFFDEAAYDDYALSDADKCSGTITKWVAIRKMLNGLVPRNTLNVWNAGWPGMNGCFMKAALKGEHVVMAELSYTNYVASSSWLDGAVQDLAKSLGVKTWLLIHSADSSQMEYVLKNTKANAVYVTSVNYDSNLPWGGPIWNYMPSYWGSEKQPYSERWWLDYLSHPSRSTKDKR